MLAALILPVASFASALLSVVAMVIVVGIAWRWPGRMFSWLMLLIAVTSIGTTLLSQRVLRLSEYDGLVVGMEGDAGGTLLAKVLLATAIGCATALCAARVFQFRKNVVRNSRFEQRGLRAPDDIVIAFTIFYVAFNILPIFFGQRNYFHLNQIYPFFIFMALFLWMRSSTIDPAIVVKQCLASIVFVSFLAAVLVPQLAVQHKYGGLIPGFNLRLWGVASHANGLGAIACALLVLEIAEPSGRAWVRRITLVAAGAALILTQSKTSLIAALIGTSMILGWRTLLSIHEQTADSKRIEPFFVSSLIGMLGVLTLAIGIWMMLYDNAMTSYLQETLNPRALSYLSTATGRTEIWEVAIKGGLENPLFGQGNGYWTTENRFRWGLLGAAHAHNLFLQVFSCSGVIGLATLLLFLYYLLKYAIRASKVTRGGSMGIVVVFFIRALSEVPLTLNAVLGAEFFAMMTYFIYIIDRGARAAQIKTARGYGQTNPVRSMHLR